jgi:DNA topoisomerase-1
VPKVITDSLGRRTTKYVKAQPDEKAVRKPAKQEVVEPKKQKKMDIEQPTVKPNKLDEYKAKYPKLEEGDILRRIKHMIPMDATDIEVYDGDPKYRCRYVDNRNRTQIRYTEEYNQKAAEEKFKRIDSLHTAIPEMRTHVNKDLTSEGMGLNKVCATIVQLIDKCYFRIGNDKYTEENGTYGVTTFQKDHLSMEGDDLEFKYVGKSSVDQHKMYSDPQVSTNLRQLMKSPGDRLFQYKDGDLWKPVKNTHVREYLKQWNMKPKDFRTYHATRICATKLAELGTTTNKTEQKRLMNEAVNFTADFLGHSAAICRKNYINGEVLRAYEDGLIMDKYVKLK